MGGGDGTEMGLVTNQESMTGVGGSLSPDFRDKRRATLRCKSISLINLCH